MSEKSAVVTATKAAQMLGVTRRYVAYLVERGELPGAYKHGDYPRSPLVIPLASVKAYLKKKRALPPGGDKAR